MKCNRDLAEEKLHIWNQEKVEERGDFWVGPEI